MGNLEDVRKVVQDFVAPGLKAIAVRLEALEKQMNIRLDHVEKEVNGRFDQAVKEANARLDQLAKELNARLDYAMKEANARSDHSEKMFLEQFSSMEKLAAARHESTTANMANSMNALEMEKRLSRLESERKAEPQHA